MQIELHPIDPQKNRLDQIAKDLNKGGLFILPTDTVYAFVTAANQKKAIEKIYQIKEMPKNKPLSLYCRDFSQISQYVRTDNNQVFRWMKNHLPGPYTLVFQASKNLNLPNITKQKTIGIRFIDHPVIQGLLERMDVPLIGSSVFSDGEYITYPDELNDKYAKQVSAIVSTGPQEVELSTVVDATDFPFEVIREGRGVL